MARTQPAGRSSRLLLLILVVALLGACTQVDGGTTNAIVVGGDDDGYNGVVLTEPYAVPEQKLVDTGGRVERFKRRAAKRQPNT